MRIEAYKLQALKECAEDGVVPPEVGELVDAYEDLKRKFSQMRDAEHSLSDSYLRIRKIVGVPNVLLNMTPEGMWSLTEGRAQDLRSKSDQLEELKKLWKSVCTDTNFQLGTKSPQFMWIEFDNILTEEENDNQDPR